jgi:hypothetical protein
MKPMKTVVKNGVKSKCQKVVSKLFFENYFLAENCCQFAKLLSCKFENENSHYVTSHEPSGYVRKAMTPGGASSASGSVV